ncbi:MAG: hypothetical protein AB7E80_06300 [Hyphomicrobiaceae bacterium]
MMLRRQAIKLMAGVSGLALFSPSLMSRLARAADAAAPGGDPGSLGLPSDFRLRLPSRIDAAARSAPDAAEAVSSDALLEVGGVRVNRATGEIDLGSLAPVGPLVPLAGEAAAVVGNAVDVLALDVLNREFNPFFEAPPGLSGGPLVGAYEKGDDIYRGRAFIPVRLVMGGLIDAAGLPKEPLQPLLAVLPELAVLATPAHQFRLADSVGNRIVFYGGGPGHSGIDLLARDLRQRGLRLLKQMVHFNNASQGGEIKAIVEDGVGGSTHVGGYSSGFDENGASLSVKSDWPYSYGFLDDYNRTYNANILAVDYRGGTRDPIPDAMIEAYCRNADMWDAAAAITVPFANEDLDPSFQEYTYNPLEVFDQASARRVAAALAQLDKTHFLQQHGAFYCAEGQFVVANLGPQEDETGGTLLKRSRFGATRLGACIDNFAKAPGYAGLTADERRRRPMVGWEHLLSLGAEGGGISSEQFNQLVATDRTAIALEWLAEDVKGWQSFGPLHPEALVARPMTVATMAWGLFRRYLPREGIAKLVVTELVKAHATGGAPVKAAVVMLAGGNDPNSPEGRMALAGLGARAAAGLHLGLLSSEEVRTRLLQKAGFEEITNDADKAKVMAAYQSFLAILQNADHNTQAALDAALRSADDELAKVQVTRRYLNKLTGEIDEAKTSLMVYAAPACFGMWAQQPWLAGTRCIAYVATAMHADQGKA